MDYQGIDYLRNKLGKKSPRVALRYRYYEMNEINRSLSPIMPPWPKDMYRSTIGWCAKSVDSLADRLVFRGFEEPDIYNAQQIFAFNNPDIFFDSAIRESLIGSCSFVHITHGENDGPVGNHNAPFLFEHVSSKDKQMKIYGNLFHEILNEYCRDEVIEDYVRWMDRRA